MTSSLIKLGAVPAKHSVFMLCDLQEKFRPILWQFQEVVQTAAKLVKLL